MSGVTNNRIRGALSWRQAKPVLLHPKLFLGFLDFQAGRPFDYRQLDCWPMLDQHRYENGRELAAECKAAGIHVVWIDRTRIPRPLKTLVVERALARCPANDRHRDVSLDACAGAPAGWGQFRHAVQARREPHLCLRGGKARGAPSLPQAWTC